MPMNVRVVVETAQRPFFLVLLAILDMSQRFDRTVSQGHPCLVPRHIKAATLLTQCAL